MTCYARRTELTGRGDIQFGTSLSGSSIMGTGSRAGVIAAILAGLAQTAGAQQERIFRGELVAPAAAGQRNMFISGDSQSLQVMQEQLNDPQQRAALLADHRASIEAGHPDLAEVLGIEEETEQKFFDLLAEQQLQRLIEFSERRPMHGSDMMQGMAESQTKLMQAQRAVLGDAAMERYRDYMDTLGARLQVSRFETRLAGPDKLQPPQKTKLIALLHEHDPLRVTPQSRPGQLFAPSHFFERLEEMLKTTLEKDRQLLAAAAAVLTAPQLKTLEQVRTENAAMLRQHLEETRARAGASAALSGPLEAQLVADAGRERKAFSGDIRIQVTVKVDGGKPSVVKHTGPNGQALELEVDGIVVEVKPILYEGNWLETQLVYYEQGPNGRRQIGSSGGAGMVSQSTDGSLFGGGGSTILTGSKKAYAIETGVAAAPLQ
jgi:hypothetical protein